MNSVIRSLFVTLACGSILGFVAACATTKRDTSVQSVPASSVAVREVRSPRGPLRRVVLVSIDGLKPDTYRRPDELGLKIPTLRRFVARGASSDGVLSVFPTLTYPSHTSLMTGVPPRKHGIYSNRSFDPLEQDLEGWRWYAEELKVEPIWRIAERQGYKTALIHLPVSVGADVSWLVPEYWRAKNRQDQKILRAVSTPGLLERVAARHPDFWDRFIPPAARDDALTDIALEILSKDEPSLVITHLIEVDAAQHKYGIWSPEAKRAIEEDDRQLGRIVQEVTRRGWSSETAFVVVSDHGFRSAPNVVRPCTLLTNAGFITVKDGKITDWQATVLANAGTAYVYVKETLDSAARQAVRQLFVAKRQEPNSGLGVLYEPEEIRALGGDPSAFMALGAAKDYQFGGGCLGEYSATATYVATHGFDPQDPEMRASLLMMGPNIPHGKIPEARLIDIAPTIAQWLGLSMPEAEGVPLKLASRS